MKQNGTGSPFYVVIRATRRSSRLQCKGSTFISPLFKTLSTSPAPRIEPVTSRSAVKRPTDWSNPAVDDLNCRRKCKSK